jgi:hypothetical protein
MATFDAVAWLGAEVLSSIGKPIALSKGLVAALEASAKDGTLTELDVPLDGSLDEGKIKDFGKTMLAVAKHGATVLKETLSEVDFITAPGRALLPRRGPGAPQPKVKCPCHGVDFAIPRQNRPSRSQQQQQNPAPQPAQSPGPNGAVASRSVSGFVVYADIEGWSVRERAAAVAWRAALHRHDGEDFDGRHST